MKNEGNHSSKSRRSRQRDTILATLRGTKAHPTALELYESVRQEMPRISLGTVYRNLKWLRERGEVLELDYGATFSRFDGNAAPHYHFTCQGCGRVFDVAGPTTHTLEREVARGTGFRVLSHRLEFYGLCADCQ